MFCDRCGKEIADTAIQCPFCGMPTEHEMQYMRPSAYQAQQVPSRDDFSSFGGPPLYQAGYSAVQPPTQSGGYIPFPQQTPGYAPTSYTPLYSHTNITVVQNTGSDAPLVAEIVLSLFGIFGVGWILGGETTTGVILLLCSIFVFWPIMILGTLFTLGIGLICLCPLAIATIIVNALLCNRVLKRRAARLVVMQSTPPPHMTMQPPTQRPQ